MSRLPPLNALRAFEASARRGGFAAAAEELNVTPAAVGQQVRQLEALIGAPLFERDGRRLTLTERGAAALGPLGRGFELIGEASSALREAEGEQAVTLAAPADIVLAWLIRDLAGRPGAMALSVMTMPPDADPGWAFERGADLALACLAERPAGAVRLMEEVYAPLASPALARAHAGLAGLEAAPLIEDASAPITWRRWADARGAYGADLSAGLRVDDAISALKLAEAGAGIVLSRKPLALDAIAAGALTPVLADGDQALGAGYQLIPAPNRGPSRAVDALSAHLKTCAAARQDMAGEL